MPFADLISRSSLLISSMVARKAGPSRKCIALLNVRRRLPGGEGDCREGSETEFEASEVRGDESDERAVSGDEFADELGGELFGVINNS